MPAAGRRRRQRRCRQVDRQAGCQEDNPGLEGNQPPAITHRHLESSGIAIHRQDRQAGKAG
jgi:hypothetical protein